ncbi:MAG TPA: ornithine carbamoyltransferase [Pseudomonadales bacterium]
MRTHQGSGVGAVVTRHFLTLLDFSPEELAGLIARGTEHKRMRAAGMIYEPLRGRTLAMLFDLASTRTRVAFEAGMQQLGGHAIFLSPNDTQLGRGEPIEDTAHVLSEMADLIMLRTLKHHDVEAFARAASVPVINAMSGRAHPCQLLADVQTFVECRGPIQGKTVAFIGDGYNMCNSYIDASRQFGFQLRIACPKGFEPKPEMLATTNGVTLTATPQDAVDGADLVVTDVWSSMGHEAEQSQRRQRFAGYQVTSGLLDLASRDALFMHCLPAHRGEEVSEDLLDDPRSVVWAEAGNRLHSQKALLEFLGAARH